MDAFLDPEYLSRIHDPIPGQLITEDLLGYSGRRPFRMRTIATPELLNKLVDSCKCAIGSCIITEEALLDTHDDVLRENGVALVVKMVNDVEYKWMLRVSCVDEAEMVREFHRKRDIIQCLAKRDLPTDINSNQTYEIAQAWRLCSWSIGNCVTLEVASWITGNVAKFYPTIVVRRNARRSSIKELLGRPIALSPCEMVRYTHDQTAKLRCNSSVVPDIFTRALLSPDEFPVDVFGESNRVTLADLLYPMECDGYEYEED